MILLEEITNYSSTYPAEIKKMFQDIRDEK